MNEQKKLEFKSTPDSISVFNSLFNNAENKELVLKGSLYTKNSFTQLAVWLDYDLNIKHKTIFSDTLNLRVGDFIINSNNNIVCSGKEFGFELNKFGSVVQKFDIDAIGKDFFENKDNNYVSPSPQVKIVKIYNPESDRINEITHNQNYEEDRLINSSSEIAVNKKNNSFYMSNLYGCVGLLGFKAMILKYSYPSYSSKIFYIDPTENCNDDRNGDFGIDFQYEDYIYFSNKAESCGFIRRDHYYCEAEYITVNCLDKDGNLRWSQYLGGDAGYRASGIIATPDSGCVVIVQRYEPNVNQEYEADIYYAKFNKDGNLVNQTPASIHTITSYSKEIDIFPNPVEEFLYFNLANKNFVDLQLEIFDLNGRLIISKLIKDDKISLKGLNTGYYTFALKDKKKSIKIGKLFKL